MFKRLCSLHGFTGAVRAVCGHIVANGYVRGVSIASEINDGAVRVGFAGQPWGWDLATFRWCKVGVVVLFEHDHDGMFLSGSTSFAPAEFACEEGLDPFVRVFGFFENNNGHARSFSDSL